mgnify:FL=1|jgi:hypothetical protein
MQNQDSMTKKIKMPLSVYILFHKDNKEGIENYTSIYHLLCRDSERPLTNGMDIPVFLRTGGDTDEIPLIDFSQSRETAIFLLIDNHMYCCEKWQQYIHDLCDRKTEDVALYPIQLCKQALDNTNLSKIQFITLTSFSLKDNWEEFQTKILDNLIRLIKGNSTRKNKLFISHSKNDKDKLGVSKAEELRDYLSSNTKLDSFFDINDIIDGHEFKKQIEANIENSLLLIFNSNTYSEREWCIIESISGKKNRVPTIVVDLVNGVVKRLFPYIGNLPVIRYNSNEDWPLIINLLLRTALEQYYQDRLLQEMKDITNDKECFILPNAPELFSVGLLKSNKCLYPEPPLSTEERNILASFKPDTTFLTPVQLYSHYSSNIKNKKIAISISESEDIQTYGGDKALLRDITIELSRHILIIGGKLVYGGDLRKFGFTELFRDLSYQYGQLEKTNRTVKYFTNYFAWPIHLKIDKDKEAEFIEDRVEIIKVDAPTECLAKDKNEYIEPINLKGKYLWAKSLTKMREEMEENVHARIILGGKVSEFQGKYTGVLEEFLVSMDKEHPIYLIGGFGGVAKIIVDLIEQKENVESFYNHAINAEIYKEFMDYYNKNNNKAPIDYNTVEEKIRNITSNGLQNGLTEKENKILFRSTNVLEIVALVLKGLNNILKEEDETQSFY